MGFWRKLVGIGLAVIAICAIALAADFEWNWRDQQTIGRTDPSLGNTSRLTEPERAALIDAIVLRLQKPMSERGYDDERIREIASTTRLRFVDLGGDKPLLFATSLGLEGGCDAMSNCPLWIFRHSAGRLCLGARRGRLQLHHPAHQHQRFLRSRGGAPRVADRRAT